MNKINYTGKSKILKGISGKINWLIDQVGTKIPVSEKGVANGVATLDGGGKVPSSQLPSYVDDVIEGYYYNDNFYADSAHTELITPETSKIYVDLPTSKTYRWGGSEYVEISSGAVQSDWDQNDSSQLDYIKHKPTIPSALADLTDDSTHRVVTDSQITSWNNKSATDENVYQQDIYYALGYGYSFPLLASCSPNDDTETNLVNKLPKVKWDSQNDWLKIYGFGGVQASILALALDGGPILNRIYGNPQANYVATTLPNHEGVLTTEKNAVLWKQQNVLGAKNLLPFPYRENTTTKNGITFTINADYSVTVSSGSPSGNTNWYFRMSEAFLPSGKYIVSGFNDTEQGNAFCLRIVITQNMSDSRTYNDYGEGVEITVNDGEVVSIYLHMGTSGVSSGNKHYVMIRPSTVADATYQEPTLTNRQITDRKVEWKHQNLLGAKNLFSYPYNNIIGASRGVNYELQADGSYYLHGTNNNQTTNSYIYIVGTAWADEMTIDKNMKIRWEGTGTGLENVTLNITKRTGSSGSRINVTNLVKDTDFELIPESNTKYDFQFAVTKLTSVDAYVFPMMRYADIVDTEYMPPSRSNRELTVGKVDVTEIAPLEQSNIASQTYAVGDYMFWYGGFYKVSTAMASGDTITTSKLTKTTLGAELKSALT